MDNSEFMRAAIALSKDSVHKHNGGPFGAVDVKDRKIVGRGNNQVTDTNDPTAHAEVTAIRDACNTLGTFSLQGCEIYSSCEPCPMCLSAIYWARLDKVYYANTQEDAAKINFDDAFLYEQVGLPIDKRSLPQEQLLRDEALQVFEDWDKKEDKTHY